MAWFAIVARSRDQRIGKSKSSLRRTGNAGSAIISLRGVDSQRSEVVQVLEAPEPKARCAGVTGRRATIDKQLARSKKPAKPVFV